MEPKIDLDIRIASLWQSIRKNDERAFSSFFQLLHPILYRHVYKHIRDTEITEEIVDDLFVNIWNKRADLEITTSVKAYLLKAGTFKAYDYHRHKYRSPQKTDLDEVRYNISESSPSAQKEMEGQELQENIVKTLQKLPPRCKVVFELSRFQDQTYRQIAESLYISIKTVENQMTKALKIMREGIFGH